MEKNTANLKSLDSIRARKWTLFDGDRTVLVMMLCNKTEDGRVHVTTDKSELIGLLDRCLRLASAEYRQRKPWEFDARKPPRFGSRHRRQVY